MEFDEIPTCGLENMKYFKVKDYHNVSWHENSDGAYSLKAIQGVHYNDNFFDILLFDSIKLFYFYQERHQVSYRQTIPTQQQQKLTQRYPLL